MNYVDTFITVASDCPVTGAVAPAPRGGKATVASIQFDLVSQRPYHYTQEDVLWLTHVRHKGLAASKANARARASFLSRPLPCLRSSPLPKRFGWGLHFDRQARVAVVAVESRAYTSLSRERPAGPRVLAALRTRRA